MLLPPNRFLRRDQTSPGTSCCTNSSSTAPVCKEPWICQAGLGTCSKFSFRWWEIGPCSGSSCPNQDQPPLSSQWQQFTQHVALPQNAVVTWIKITWNCCQNSRKYVAAGVFNDVLFSLRFWGDDVIWLMFQLGGATTSLPFMSRFWSWSYRLKGG